MKMQFCFKNSIYNEKIEQPIKYKHNRKENYNYRKC